MQKQLLRGEHDEQTRRTRLHIAQYWCESHRVMNSCSAVQNHRILEGLTTAEHRRAVERTAQTATRGALTATGAAGRTDRDAAAAAAVLLRLAVPLMA